MVPAAASVGAGVVAGGKPAALALPIQVRRRRSTCKVAAAASSSSEIILPNKYCESVFKTVRRPTRTINIGNVKVGSEHPVRLQTMTTTDTRNVAATVEQVKRCVDAGAELVRITVQGRKEAQACGEIREALFKDNYSVPLVADIHFQPQVAMMVADAFEKIRINPGNFADGRKTFDEINYDDPAQFAAEQESIRETFVPLVEKCKSLGRAMRIGTNHGSLSARILSYYGDTPRGMVESAFEFADICRDMDYHNFLFSMKASNPLVMVQAYRLLSEEMYAKGWDYPLHLGVTEAGEGEDGRMKSAIGIGSLLMDGLGDTLRVSLTEDPDLEMAPARTLERLGVAALGKGIPDFGETHRDTKTFTRRVGRLPEQREGDALDFRPLLHRDGSVLSAVSASDLSNNAEATYRALGAKLVVGMPFKDLATSDSIVLDDVPADADGARAVARLQEVGVGVVVPADKLERASTSGAAAAAAVENYVALYKLASIAKAGKLAPPSPLPKGAARYAVAVDGSEADEQLAALASAGSDCVLALLDPEAAGLSRVHASRRVFEILARNNADVSVIHHKRIPKGASRDELVIAAGSELGALLVDGLGDGVLIQAEDPREHELDYLRTTSFGLLQGSRMRNTKTEYVSCPSCGRTLFDLQEITEQIRVQTGHLPGVSIAIMGCIVNGPGEMADADFGYVGGAPGKIDLYVGKEVVRRGIPMETACDELIELIKEHGRWVEPSSEEEGGGVGAAEEEVASAVA